MFFSLFYFEKPLNELTKKEVKDLLNGLGFDIKVKGVDGIEFYREISKKDLDDDGSIVVLFNKGKIANVRGVMFNPFEDDVPSGVVRKDVFDFDKIVKKNHQINILITAVPMEEDLIYYDYTVGKDTHIPVFVCSLRNIEPDKRPDFISPLAYVN